MTVDADLSQALGDPRRIGVHDLTEQQLGAHCYHFAPQRRPPTAITSHLTAGPSGPRLPAGGAGSPGAVEEVLGPGDKRDGNRHPQGSSDRHVGVL